MVGCSCGGCNRARLLKRLLPYDWMYGLFFNNGGIFAIC